MDPLEYPYYILKTIWKENQLIDPVFKPPQISYYMVFGGSLLYFLTFFMSSTEPDFFNMLFNFISFLMLLAIILSQAWLPHIVCTIFTSVAPLLILAFFRENVISYLGCYMIIPQFILLSNSNLLLYSYTSLTQFYFLQFKLKECIPEICRVMNSHSPFEQFLEGAPILYFFFMVSYGITFYSLRKRAALLEQDKKQITGLYEQHQAFTIEFSHELRNPINSLLNNLQFVMQERITEKANSNIQAALLSGEMLMQLINNILDSGKLKAGKLEILSVPTNIHDLSQRVWMMFSELIKRKELTGTLRIDKRIPTTLHLDPQRIIQILFNLVSNAIKFTNNGEVMISLQWVNQAVLSDKCFEPIPYDDEDEGLFEKNEKIAILDLSSRLGSSHECYVLTQDRKTFNIDGKVFPFQKVKGMLKIVVKDTGAGMDKKAIDCVFQKYGQGHGTGLGLYLVSEICTKMGGSAKAYSKVGKGTTFIACVPTQTPSEQVQINFYELGNYKIPDAVFRENGAHWRLKETQVFAKDDNSKWVLVHAHYSNMPVTAEGQGF